MSKGSVDNSGQNDAARQMADIAGQMWDQYKTTYLPMEQQYVSDAQNYDTPQRREQYAGMANADVTQAFDSQRQQQERELARYGVSPDSAKFANINSRLRLQEAASGAGAQNQARQQVENMGWARRTDALSLGKGLPAQASSGYANAANAFGGAAKTSMAQDQANSQNVASGATGAYTVGRDLGWWGKPTSDPTSFADGGMVDVKGIQRYAGGGPVMGGPQQILGMAQQAAGTAQPSVQPGINPGNVVMAGRMGKGLYNMATAAQAAPTGAVLEPGAADLLSTQGGIASAAGAADAATTAAAATEAAAATDVAATTIPEALATLIALAKDGGPISQPANGIPGGPVSGPGTETSDSIPAMLSDGEFVINAEAVKHFGVDRFNKMNEVGLKARYGIKR